jgi:hypothetical protein
VALWIGLAASASLLLLATTNQVTTNVAPVPLLWIAPLTVYLVTFVIAFSQRVRVPLQATVPLTLGTAYWCWWTLSNTLRIPIVLQLAAYHSFLFCGCLLCHTLLYDQRPSSDGRATSHYYLMISLGGVIGGTAVALGAPLLLAHYMEFHIGAALIAGIAVWSLFAASEPWTRAWRIPALVAGALFLFLLQEEISRQHDGVIHSSRNFFGAIEVHRQEKAPGIAVHSLLHGKVCHGVQFTAGPEHRMPSAYFGRGSGAGQAISYLRETTHRPLRIGILGMGIGVMSAYGKPGDYIRYYEIDPAVVALAHDRQYFTYLTDSMADIDVVIGDARLSLERELEDERHGRFDLLVVDVFSGDAIATHFLTREAFALYAKHLQLDGIIAFHVSNAFVDLLPPISAGATATEKLAGTIHAKGDRSLTTDSLWAIACPEEHPLLMQTEAMPQSHEAWSDDYSSLLPLMLTRRAAQPRSD